jgi:peptidoglycan/LPS O-acetylase OafA/YrhL
MSQKSRNLTLDLLRIFAACWVLIYHWTATPGFYALLETEPDLSSLPTFVTTFSSRGFLGVDIFFILSGAVIARSALLVTWQDFVFSRFVRLFPVYFIVTALTIVILPLNSNITISVHDFFSLSGLQFWVGGRTPVSAAWTIPIEIAFYGLVAFAIWVSSFKGTFNLKKLKYFLDLWMLLYVFGSASGFAPLQYALVPRFAPYFILGAIVINISTWLEFKKNLIRISVAFTLSLKLILSRIEESPELDGKFLTSVIVLLSCTLVIYFSGRTKQKSNGVRSRSIVSTLSLMTYPLYLIHQEIGMTIISILSKNQISIFVSFFLTLAIVLLVSWLLVCFVEPKVKKYFATLSSKND